MNSDNKELSARRMAAIPRGIAVKSELYAQRAQGAEIWDVEGSRFIDLTAGIGVLNVGHRHPRIISAIEAQLGEYLHTCFHAVPYEPYIRLAEKLNQLAPGKSKKKTALFNSGAEAIENAIKVARVHTGKHQVIAFADSFHGRTFMALSMTGKDTPLKTGLGSLMPGVFHVPFPNPREISVNASLQAIRELLMGEVTDLAAIIIEPVQGEGGFNIAPKEFLQSLRSLCDETGALLIADEIQSGFGRTGKYFAIEHADVEPDLIAVAKSLGGGLPVSGLIGKSEVMDAAPAGALGSTYGGNPLCCAAALAVLDVIESENLLARAEELGSKLEARLIEIYARFENQIVEVRRLGAMVAVEFHSPEAVKAIIDSARSSGLLLLSAGRRAQVIRLLPPLVIEWQLLEEALDILESSSVSVLSSYA